MYFYCLNHANMGNYIIISKQETFVDWSDFHMLGANFDNLNLGNANLSNAKMSYSSMNGTIFGKNAKLNGTDLYGISLSNATFNGKRYGKLNNSGNTYAYDGVAMPSGYIIFNDHIIKSDQKKTDDATELTTTMFTTTLNSVSINVTPQSIRNLLPSFNSAQKEASTNGGKFRITESVMNNTGGNSTDLKSLFTNRTEPETRQLRKEVAKQMFIQNKDVLNNERMIIPKSMLGISSSKIQDEINLINTSFNPEYGSIDVENQYDITSLPSNESVYVMMESDVDFNFITKDNKILRVEKNGSNYDVYENYVEETETYDKVTTVTEGYEGTYNEFVYIIGSVTGGGDSGSTGGDSGTNNADICFPADTPVNTDQGIIMIQDIVPGKHTIRDKRIRCITKTALRSQKHLVKIHRNALGINKPNRVTYISQDHGVLCKGRMIRAKNLKYFTRKVSVVPYNGEPLYNILMDRHEKIVVNNMVAETLHPQNKYVKRTLRM